MFSLARCVCLTAMILELDLHLLNTEQVCVDELLSLLDNPTSVLCKEYSTCLVLVLELHQRDLSVEDIEDIEGPYQQELVRMSVDCDLNFASVIGQLTGQVTSAWPTTATTVSTTISTSATPKTTTTTTRTPTFTTTTAPMSTVTDTPKPSTSTTAPISTVTDTTKPSTSTTEKSTSTITPSPTTTTASPSTSKITLTTTTPTTPRHITTTPTKSVTPTTAQTPSPRITSSPTSPKSSSPTTDSEIPGCIRDTINGCTRRPDGHYPACFPVCKKGVYITCTNGRTVISECQFGWYNNPQRQRFLARIMFHPATKRCEYKSAFCPRELDSQV